MVVGLVYFVFFALLLWKSGKLPWTSEGKCYIAKEPPKKVLYNLAISIECGTDIRKTILHSVEDEIERLGIGIYRAKKLLVGNWRVVEGGYLFRGFSMEAGIKKYTAVLEIDDATPGLQFLEKLLAGTAVTKETSSRVYLHYKEGGLVNVGVDENGLFVH